MTKVVLDKKIVEGIVSKMNMMDNGVAGVYFLRHNGNIVYVGQSKDIKARISSHVAMSEKVFDDFTLIECPVDLLETTETAYIYRYDPIFNKRYSLTDGMSTEEYCDANNIEYIPRKRKKQIKVKEIALAKFYGVTTQTLRNYRNSDDVEMNRRYEALRSYYIECMEDKDETCNNKS